MKKKSGSKTQQKQKMVRSGRKSQINSYRLQCAQTGNGLSHYVMYGDEKNSLL
ncbi:MAG: hypothetical protein HZC17_07135 [Candidatus Omnitrophica bacterium]|nr:hypothetical protein [Candidatus Omnitrophota bacterium]